MDIIQECAIIFKNLSETTKYTFHTSLNKKISVFDVDFQFVDFHHAVGLQHLSEITIPRNTKNTINWILDAANPITDDYLKRDGGYKGKPNQGQGLVRLAGLYHFA